MSRQAPVICVMAPPIHLGAWSMALMPFELFIAKGDTHTHTHTHTPVIGEYGSGETVERSIIDNLQHLLCLVVWIHIHRQNGTKYLLKKQKTLQQSVYM